MAKLRPLEMNPASMRSINLPENANPPATPDEKLAASALLTLLSSPAPSPIDSRRKEGFSTGPAMKRQKSDPTLSRAAEAATQGESAKPLGPLPQDGRNVMAVVAAAMGGEGYVEPAKLEEASKWLYRQVELVRGKYKGRVATVVGMTAKKYRVRVDAVEHQLEFYPSMFKHPVPVNPGLLSTLQRAAQPEVGQFPCNNVGQTDTDRSCSGSTGEDVSGDAPIPSPTEHPNGGPPRTKADLIRLMEETSEEMQRAKSLLLGYQEASRQHGVLITSPRGGVASNGGGCFPVSPNPRSAAAHHNLSTCSPRAVAGGHGPIVQQGCALSNTSVVAPPHTGVGAPQQLIKAAPNTGSVEAAPSTSTAPSLHLCGASASTGREVMEVERGKGHIGDPSLKLSTVMSSTHISPRAQNAPPEPAHVEAVQPLPQPKSECTSA